MDPGGVPEMKNSREKIDGIVLVPKDSERMLNARSLKTTAVSERI